MTTPIRPPPLIPDARFLSAFRQLTAIALLSQSRQNDQCGISTLRLVAPIA